MALKQSNLTNIPQRNKDAAFGFVKEYEKEVANVTIPKMIKYLCLVYFNSNKDAFDTKQTNSKIIIDGDCIQVKKYSIMSTALKKMKVNSYFQNIASNGIHIWRIQCKKGGVYGDTFGIRNIDISSSLTLCGEFDSNKDSVIGYALYLIGLKKEMINDGSQWTNGGTPREFAKECVTNDIIEMTLNLTESSLHYKINDEDYGRAFSVKQGRYRACIGLSMWDSVFNRASNVVLQLLSYQHIV